MEEYKNVDNSMYDTLNTTDATNATTIMTMGYENKALYQGMDIARQLEVEVEKKHGLSIRVFKATSGNEATKLKAK